MENDPRNVVGKAEETLKMTTYTEPVEPKGMTEKYVVPGNGGGKGTKSDPFKGLDAAVAAAQPGTLFLLRKIRSLEHIQLVMKDKS